MANCKEKNNVKYFLKVEIPSEIRSHDNILCSNQNIRSLRESFFVSQLKIDYDIKYAQKGDFVVDDMYVFEIGSKNKSFEQIKDMPEIFVAADDIEVGFKNKIPLWLFGFIY
ncbi:MAG: hypothetical protein WC390_01290 [Sulfurimonas sp.]